jgi:hypothetical protein
MGEEEERVIEKEIIFYEWKSGVKGNPPFFVPELEV